jgi:hypothetical protein
MRAPRYIDGAPMINVMSDTTGMPAAQAHRRPPDVFPGVEYLRLMERFQQQLYQHTQLADCNLAYCGLR